MKKSRLVAALVTAAMTVAMFGMNVCAVDAPNGPAIAGEKEFSFDKYLVMDKNANVPDVEFTFSIEAGEAIEAGENQNEILAGIGTPVFVSEVADFNNTDTAYTSLQTGDTVTFDAASQKYAVKEMTIDFSGVEFVNPGIYRYVITEAGENAAVTNDSESERLLDVYVTTDDENNLTIADYVFYYVNEKGAMVKANYTNTYATKDITLEKVVTGNQGDRNADFDFTISITDADPNTKYTVVKTAQSGSTTSAEIVTDAKTGAASYKVSLKDKEKVVVYGLTADTKYTIEEDSYANYGYTTKWDDVASADYKTADATVANVTKNLVVGETLNVTFENNRDVVTPTGVLVNVAPYVVMVVFAAILAVVFLRRRRSSEF